MPQQRAELRRRELKGKGETELATQPQLLPPFIQTVA